MVELDEMMGKALDKCVEYIWMISQGLMVDTRDLMKCHGYLSEIHKVHPPILGTSEKRKLSLELAIKMFSFGDRKKYAKDMDKIKLEFFGEEFGEKELRIFQNLWGRKECKVCKKKSQVLKWCSRCQSIYYCGKKHQKRDWKVHKLYCKDYSKC